MLASLDATVTSTYPLTIARSAVEPYLGRYILSAADSNSSHPPQAIELHYENGSLKARYDPAPSWYPQLQGSIMTRINWAWRASSRP